MPPLPGSPGPAVNPSPAAPNAPGMGSMAPHTVTAPAPPTQGIHVPTGLPYGQGQALHNAQKSMPLPSGPGPSGSNPPANLLTHPDTLAAAQQWSPPTTALAAPSSRPNEPVTTGIATGPGPGPSVLAPTQPPDPLVAGLAILNQLGPRIDSQTANLKAVVQAMIGNRMAS